MLPGNGLTNAGNLIAHVLQLADLVDQILVSALSGHNLSFLHALHCSLEMTERGRAEGGLQLSLFNSLSCQPSIIQNAFFHALGLFSSNYLFLCVLGFLKMF